MKNCSKRNLDARCYLCGVSNDLNSPLTTDHVIPDALFLSPKPQNLITLPFCKKCQKKYEKDEEYFRNNLSMCADVLKHEKGHDLWQKSLRSMKRSMGIRKDTIAQLMQRSKYSSGGIYLGEEVINKVNLRRMNHVLRKMIIGLHVYHGGLSSIPISD